MSNWALTILSAVVTDIHALVTAINITVIDLLISYPFVPSAYIYSIEKYVPVWPYCFHDRATGEMSHKHKYSDDYG